MIDNIKIFVKSPEIAKKIWDNPLFEIDTKIKKNRHCDNSIKYKKTIKSYKKIKLEKTQRSLVIKFSPHYYFNNGSHNANQFGVFECIETLTEVIELLSVEPKWLKIENLEFAVNVICNQYRVEEVIDNIIYYKKTQFLHHHNLEYSKYTDSTYLSIKCYAKGIQKFNYYFPDPRTLRYEISSKQSKYFNKLGIYTLEDLLDFNVYSNLINELRLSLNHILILEPNIEKERFSSKEYEELLILNNKTHYDKFKNKTKNVNQFNNNRKRLYGLLDKQSQYSYKYIYEIINKRLDELLIKSEYSTIRQKRSISIEEIENEYSTNSTIGILTFRKCLLTGLDISMQKKESKFLSSSGLEYYKENAPTTYKEILNKYCSKSCLRNGDVTYIHYYISHNVRNTYWNKKYRRENILKSGQLEMQF